MKKLLAIVMVLGLASIASAGLDFTWVASGTGYNLSIISDGTVLTDVTLALITDKGTLTGGVKGANIPDAAASFVFTGTAASQGITGLNGQDGLVFNAASFTGASYPAGVWFTDIILSQGAMVSLCDVTNDWDIAMGDGDMATVTHAVPEPITMTLMGLGGLVALRRRMA